MPILFKGSNELTLGVEIELQIIDPENLDLTPQAEGLLKACHSRGIEHVKAEIHQSMLEIDTAIAPDVKACRSQLQQTLKRIKETALELGLEIATSGTHPFQRWMDRIISHEERYQHLHQKFQWLARRMNVYGMHVHVGMPTGEQALKVSNGLIRYLPHLLALSANSPFGMEWIRECNRPVSILWDRFPREGLQKFLKTGPHLNTTTIL